MSNKQKKVNYKFSQQQKLQIIKCRQALETDFRMCNNKKQKSELWTKIFQQLTEKDSSMNSCPIPKIQSAYSNAFNAYKRIKADDANKGSMDMEVFKLLDTVFKDDPSLLRKSNANAIHQLVLNARLSRHADFSIPTNDHHNKLWQEILDEVKAKAVGCTEELTTNQIRQIFQQMLYTYKMQGSRKEKRFWPYFHQLHKVYGNDNDLEMAKDSIEYQNLEQIVLNARLSRETEFQRIPALEQNKLWQQILGEVKANTTCSSIEQLNSETIQKIFENMLFTYRNLKRKQNKSCWPYFDQMDKIYGHEFEMKKSSNEYKILQQVVLNARLSREAEFQKYSTKNSFERGRLWQEILGEVKENTAICCTVEINIPKIRDIFKKLYKTYKVHKRNKTGSSWPYFDQMNKIYGNDGNELKWQKHLIEYRKLQQLVLNARLCREADFQKYTTNNSFERKKLWQEILAEVKANAAGCCTVEINGLKIKQIFMKLHSSYKLHKRNKTGSSWPYFDQMDKIYGHDGSELKLNERSIEYRKLQQLVLNARFSRDADFKKYSTRNTFQRNKLWQEVLWEVKAKAADCCTVELNKLKIQRIFMKLYSSYKEHKRKKTGSSWPYFDQMHKICTNNNAESKLVLKPCVYKKINHELKNLLICARLSREAKFKQCRKGANQIPLWQEILHEIKANLKVCCAEELNIAKIKYIFGYMRQLYKRQRNKGNMSWPYYAQFDKVYGNCEALEIFTTNNDCKNVVWNDDSISFTATANLIKILKEKALRDRAIIQQICDIEKNKLELQRAEINELRKLLIFYENKNTNIITPNKN